MLLPWKDGRSTTPFLNFFCAVGDIFCPKQHKHLGFNAWPTRDQFTRDDDFQTHQAFHPQPTQKWPQIDLFSSRKLSQKWMRSKPKNAKSIFGDQKKQQRSGFKSVNFKTNLPVAKSIVTLGGLPLAGRLGEVIFFPIWKVPSAWVKSFP